LGDHFGDDHCGDFYGVLAVSIDDNKQSSQVAMDRFR